MTMSLNIFLNYHWQQDEKERLLCRVDIDPYSASIPPFQCINLCVSCQPIKKVVSFLERFHYTT